MARNLIILPLQGRIKNLFGAAQKLMAIRSLYGMIKFPVLCMSAMPGLIILMVLTYITRKDCQRRLSGQISKLSDEVLLSNVAHHRRMWINYVKTVELK